MGITVSSFVEDSDLRVRMLAFVLLLPLTAAVSVVGRTDLIDGHFKYKAAPGDGIEDYYGRRWGIPTEVVGKFKEEPYVEVWQLHESGSGFNYLAEDQGVTEIQTHKFTAAGIEKTFVATKADGGMGERIVFKSFHERVDENGTPISQPLLPLTLALPFF